MPERLRIGVIGCGRMGAFHIRNYPQLDCAQLVAVADPDESARQRAVAGMSVAEYGDWREMIERELLDAISVACNSEAHAEVALGALDAGLHVLVEKPIATNVPDALRMRSAAMEAGRKLMVGHIERFNPAVAKLRELVAEGRLGSDLPGSGDPGRPAARAHPGRRRRDRPRDPRSRRDAARARRRHRRDLRRRAAFRARAPRRIC